jgi:hypothetical protein
VQARVGSSPTFGTLINRIAATLLVAAIFYRLAIADGGMFSGSWAVPNASRSAWLD